jgi:hypothetical protein
MNTERLHVVMMFREAHSGPGGVFEECCMPVLGHDGNPVVYSDWPEADKVARRLQRETHGMYGQYLTNISYHPGWITSKPKKRARR